TVAGAHVVGEEHSGAQAQQGDLGDLRVLDAGLAGDDPAESLEQVRVVDALTAAHHGEDDALVGPAAFEFVVVERDSQDARAERKRAALPGPAKRLRVRAEDVENALESRDVVEDP